MAAAGKPLPKAWRYIGGRWHLVTMCPPKVACGAYRKVENNHHFRQVAYNPAQPGSLAPVPGND